MKLTLIYGDLPTYHLIDTECPEDTAGQFDEIAQAYTAAGWIDFWEIWREVGTAYYRVAYGSRDDFHADLSPLPRPESDVDSNRETFVI
jgi:hypothetical protein